MQTDPEVTVTEHSLRNNDARAHSIHFTKYKYPQLYFPYLYIHTHMYLPLMNPFT